MERAQNIDDFRWIEDLSVFVSAKVFLPQTTTFSIIACGKYVFDCRGPKWKCSQVRASQRRKSWEVS